MAFFRYKNPNNCKSWPTSLPKVAPTIINGTKRPLGTDRPYVQNDKKNVEAKNETNAQIPKCPSK